MISQWSHFIAILFVRNALNAWLSWHGSFSSHQTITRAMHAQLVVVCQVYLYHLMFFSFLDYNFHSSQLNITTNFKLEVSRIYSSWNYKYSYFNHALWIRNIGTCKSNLDFTKAWLTHINSQYEAFYFYIIHQVLNIET